MIIQGQVSTPRGGHLSAAATIGDVKRFLVRLIRRVDRGHITVKKANCMGQLANVLISAIHNHELEQRLCQLEADQESGGMLLRAERTLLITVSGEHHEETD